MKASNIIITVILMLSMVGIASAISYETCSINEGSYSYSIPLSIGYYYTYNVVHSVYSPYGDTVYLQWSDSGSVQAGRWQTINITSSTQYYPYHSPVLSMASTICQIIRPNEIGASLTFDKTEYHIGDIAHMTISFNATNFDNNKYLYQAYLTNPVTAESQVFTLTQPSSTFSQTMTTSGIWESTVWISDRSDINQGIYNVHDQRVVSASSPISFITWQYHTSELGGQGSDGKFTYGVSSSSFDYVSSLKINMYRNGFLVDTWNDVSNFGTIYYPLTQPGIYKVDLIQSVAYIETVLKSDTNTINSPQSTIASSKSSYTTDEQIMISGAMYPDTTEKNYYYVIISHYQSITSVSSTKLMEYSPYTFSQTYNLPVGRYTASLYGYSAQCVVDGDSICMHEKDYVTFDVTQPLVNNQHPINISWVKSSEKLWTVAWVSYQNSSVSDTIKIYDNAGKEFKSWSTAMYPYTLGVQLPQEPSYIGNWSAKIINGSNSADVKYSYLQVLSASQQNFSNDVGVSMDWDTPIGTSGMHELTWNTGTYSGSYYIKLVNGVTGVYVNQYQYTTGSSKAQHQSMYLSDKTSIYSAQFVSGNDTILSSANIQISANAAPLPTTAPGTGAGHGQDSVIDGNGGNEIVYLLQSKLFWAMVLIVGIMTAVGLKTGRI